MANRNFLQWVKDFFRDGQDRASRLDAFGFKRRDEAGAPTGDVKGAVECSCRTRSETLRSVAPSNREYFVCNDSYLNYRTTVVSRPSLVVVAITIFVSGGYVEYIRGENF